MAAGLFVPTVASAATSTAYIVRPGDSLWSIASAHHTSASTIEKANHLHSSLLHIGQKLLLEVPSSSSPHPTSAKPASKPSASGSPRTITVHSGQSLWSIAQQNGVSVSALENWNGLTSNSVLHVGQKLRIGGPLQARGSSTLSGRSSSVPVGFTAAVKGAGIAQYAEQFIGAPYRWGGESPAGFDCSGLVQFAFGHFGVNLGRTSYAQYQSGYSVSKANLIPGDLVFFDTDGPGASHVGIYIGGGRFVNAASWRVEIDSLDNSYWGGHYLGAKRVL